MRSCRASRFARYALATSAIVGALAIGLFSYGVFADGLEIKVRIISLVAGVLLMFVGVAMIASRVVRPLAYVLGAPGARFGGTAGQARPPERGPQPDADGLHGRRGDDRPRADHVRRGHRPGLQVPRSRARSTSCSSADYAVSAGINGEPLTNKAAKAVAKAPGVEAISEIRSGEAKVGGKNVLVTGVDANLTKVDRRSTWASGSDAASRRSSAGTAPSCRSATPRTTR